MRKTPKKQAEETLAQSANPVRRFQGVGHISLPIFHDGKVVRIRPDLPSEFVWEDLPYESKIHIDKALAAGEIKEITE